MYTEIVRFFGAKIVRFLNRAELNIDVCVGEFTILSSWKRLVFLGKMIDENKYGEN